MLIIFGTRQYVTQLAMLTRACPHCGTQSAHPLRRISTKFTLFFVPLFTVRTRYETQCTYCGFVSWLTKRQALESPA